MNATYTAALLEVLTAGRNAQNAGRWDEALQLYQNALVEWQPRGGAPAAELLRRSGLVHYHRGDYGVALNLFESSRRIANEAGLPDQVASATNALAIVHQALGQLDLALSLYEAARAAAQQAGNARLEAQIEQNMGIVACIRGDARLAIERYQSALEKHETLGDVLGATRVLNNLGMAFIDLEHWTDSERVLTQALVQAEHLGNRELLATVQLNRAELYLKLCHFDEARACCDQAFEIFSRLESKSGLGETYKTYGMIFRESGKLHLAEAHLSVVTELAHAADDPLLEAEAEAQVALVHMAHSRNADALRSLNRAHRLFASLNAKRELVDVDRQLDKLEESYLRVVELWGASIESTDRYTAGHSRRVAHYTERLAAACGFTGRELTWIRMGAFLHDVGKTVLDPAILNKTGPLNSDEWQTMRRHTIAGDEIVSGLGFPYDIRPMIRSHHERWDGRGYPDCLAGEQIPLTARILGIADAFDALTTDRSYRGGYSPLEALEFMAAEAGGHFDPGLLRIFAHVIAEQGTG